MNPKFQLGQVVMTRGIAALMTEDFDPEVRKCLERHHYGDWGDVCDEDTIHINCGKSTVFAELDLLGA